MVNPRNAVCFLAAFLIASAPLALAQGTYTQIDPPGSLLTHATGINNVGDIVGFYYDVAGAHGFVLNGDVYTSVNLKGQATNFGGVNDLRQVVGVSTTGFVYDLNTQEFKTIIDPITQQQTTPTCINNAGTVGGYYYYHGHFHGFALVGSDYIDIQLPHEFDTYVYGISTKGKLVGFAGANFEYFRGVSRRLLLPSLPSALELGINNAGTALVGVYLSTPDVAAGFVYQNGVVQTVQFPGSNITEATAINDAGEVVGFFLDSNGRQHGFLWTPPAGAAKR
ncbi:MAG: hypothetical protein LAN83_06325 [Acidobacteriia bacterium]|nr:hypothetical protein [Terriglobia bacterium]